MKVKSPLLVLCLPAVLAGCHHNPSPWDGQWYLDASRSHFAAPAFTVAASPDGMFHYDDGFVDYAFRCDGKPYPTAPGTAGVVSCTQSDPKTLLLKRNTNGPDSTSTRWELSADGKTLTTTDRLIQIDESAKDKKLIYTRDTGTTGFDGRWKAANPSDAYTKTVVLILNYNAFHFEDSEWGQVSDSLIGEPARTILGANQPFGYSRSVRLIGPHELQTDDSFGGHVIAHTDWKVSDDGKTLLEETSASKNPAEKNLFVYHKP